MHLVRPLQRGDRRLAQADMADLAFADQIRHRAHDVFDRHLRIDPMLIIKIDLFYAQAPQAAFHRAPDILGPAADAARRRIRRIAQDAELGGQEHLLPFALDRFPTNSSLVCGPYMSAVSSSVTPSSSARCSVAMASCRSAPVE